MQHLATAPSITVQEFAELAKLPRAAASRTLVHLVKASVLCHQPRVDEEDRFFVKSDAADLLAAGRSTKE